MFYSFQGKWLTLWDCLLLHTTYWTYYTKKDSILTRCSVTVWSPQALIGFQCWFVKSRFQSCFLFHNTQKDLLKWLFVCFPHSLLRSAFLPCLRQLPMLKYRMTLTSASSQTFPSGGHIWQIGCEHRKLAFLNSDTVFLTAVKSWKLRKAHCSPPLVDEDNSMFLTAARLFLFTSHSENFQDKWPVSS